MTREIKYRAWDKKENKMCQVEIINLDKGCFLLGNSPTPMEQIDDRTFSAEIKEGHFVLFDDLILMQSTGLKDKKGNDVYHKDNLKSGKKIFVVEWQKEEARFILLPCLGNSDSWKFMDECNHMEVIGNIYNNHK